MIKDLAWKTFKNTGSIDTFLELMKVEKAEQQIKNNAQFAVFNDNFPTNIENINTQNNKGNTL